MNPIGHVVESMVKKKRRKKQSNSTHSTGNETPISDSDTTLQREVGVVDLEERGVASQQEGVSTDNLSSSPSLASLGSDLETPRYVALDAMLPGNQSSSEAEAEAAVNATAMVLSATLSSPSPSLPNPPQVISS